MKAKRVEIKFNKIFSIIFSSNTVYVYNVTPSTVLAIQTPPFAAC